MGRSEIDAMRGARMIWRRELDCSHERNEVSTRERWGCHMGRVGLFQSEGRATDLRASMPKVEECSRVNE